MIDSGGTTLHEQATLRNNAETTLVSLEATLLPTGRDLKFRRGKAAGGQWSRRVSRAHAIGRCRPLRSRIEMSCWRRSTGTGSSSSSPCSSTCTASPAPSWCRSQAVDSLLADGAGFAGFAAGPMGQVPVVARHPGHARPQLLHACTLAARPRHLPVRPPRARASPGPSRPGSSCVARSSGCRDTGCTLKVGAEAEYFLVRRTADGGHRSGRPPGPLGHALLRRPGPDPDVRPPHDGVAPHERARLGQLRQRPRGRQRAVRAELPLRRSPDHRGSGDRVPLHGPRAWPPRRGCWRPSCPSRSPTSPGTDCTCT